MKNSCLNQKRSVTFSPAKLVQFTLFLLLMSLGFVGCKKTADPAPKAGIPPVIVVNTPTRTAALGAPVVLDATSSTTLDNKTLTYSWAIKQKPVGSTAVITNPNSLTAGFTPDKPGTYILVLTVTDASNQSSSVEVTLMVALPGRPPIANAGVSGTVQPGKRIALDGSKSSDPDGDKLTYNWGFKSKPAGSLAVISNADKAVAEFTADALGTYVVSLTVSDGIWPSVTSEASITAVTPTSRETSGSWTASTGTGGGNDYTPRNHFYSFEVTGNNQPVSLTLTSSDINVGFYVYNQNGEVVDRYGSGFGRNQTDDFIVNAGKYTVLVCSGQRYDIGAYALKGRGLNTDFTRIPALRQLAANVSFGVEGGGGVEITPRNHYYTFEVTADNSTIDINLQSPETPVWLTLFGTAGEQIRYSYVGAPQHLLEKLNKGTYSLWVGASTRDVIGKFSLDIFGQVQNLQEYVFDSSILNDEYRGKNATTTYTLNVTADNTKLDISLRSPDVIGAFTIYDPTGRQVGYSYNGNYQYVVLGTSKGQYKIVVQPASNTSGIGKYALSVYGKFTDLKKQ
jgi:heme/copper-type cytochrome/quinol oxidase subunit 2